MMNQAFGLYFTTSSNLAIPEGNRKKVKIHPSIGKAISTNCSSEGEDNEFPLGVIGKIGQEIVIIICYDFDISDVLFFLCFGTGVIGPVDDFWFVMGEKVGTVSVLGGITGDILVIAEALVCWTGIGTDYH